MTTDRTLPIDCPMCGYRSDERYDNAMRTKSGEYIYRRGIRILHRCTESKESDTVDENPFDEARNSIKKAFLEINQLPHGTDKDVVPLINALRHLAMAGKALDTWKQEQDLDSFSRAYEI